LWWGSGSGGGCRGSERRQQLLRPLAPDLGLARCVCDKVAGVYPREELDELLSGQGGAAEKDLATAFAPAGLVSRFHRSIPQKPAHPVHELCRGTHLHPRDHERRERHEQETCSRDPVSDERNGFLRAQVAHLARELGSNITVSLAEPRHSPRGIKPFLLLLLLFLS
jgi:hypothetical protein